MRRPNVTLKICPPLTLVISAKSWLLAIVFTVKMISVEKKNYWKQSHGGPMQLWRFIHHWSWWLMQLVDCNCACCDCNMRIGKTIENNPPPGFVHRWPWWWVWIVIVTIVVRIVVSWPVQFYFAFNLISKLTMARAKPTANMLTRWVASPILTKLVLSEICFLYNMRIWQCENGIQFDTMTMMLMMTIWHNDKMTGKSHTICIC